MKLLLVEDDIALHTTLSRSLSRLGWELEVWPSGAGPLARTQTRCGHAGLDLAGT
jgi:ActR/RegA family two-component response regulator